MSDRDVFTGVHVTEAVKEALRVEARRRHMSMSAYIYEAILEKLSKEGIELEKQESEEDIRLPLNAA